jgi:hypothetical protein
LVPQQPGMHGAERPGLRPHQNSITKGKGYQ